MDMFKLWDERDRLLNAIKEHHAQKADDRCIEDDDKLYAAAGLPPCDRRVGDKFEMAKNCLRFIDRRCEGGKWPSYAELEKKNKEIKDICLSIREHIKNMLENTIRPNREMVYGCEIVFQALERILK